MTPWKLGFLTLAARTVRYFHLLRWCWRGHRAVTRWWAVKRWWPVTVNLIACSCGRVFYDEEWLD